MLFNSFTHFPPVSYDKMACLYIGITNLYTIIVVMSNSAKLINPSHQVILPDK